MVNLTGALFDAKSYNFLEERNVKSDSIELFDEMWQQNNKVSLIADVEYTKELNFGATLSVGNKFKYGRLNSTVENTLSSGDYITNQNSNYTYAELGGKANDFMYRATLSANYYTNSDNKTSYNSWTFTPKLIAGYTINDKNMIRAVYQRMSSNPSLSELSPNQLFISEGIVKSGNPLLKNSTTDAAIVMYSGAYRWIELNLAGGYMYENRPINSFFVEDGDYISQRYENADWAKSLVVEASLSIIPFKNRLLTLKANGGVENKSIMSKYIGKYSHLSYQMGYEAMLNYKKFSLIYQGNIPMWSLNGPYIQLGERQSNLIVNYKIGDITLSANCFWFCSKALYQTRSINTSLVDYDFTKEIKDNNSMLTLGVSWRFNSGKKYNEGKRSRNNSDSDTGLF